ncbi:dihydropyrimidinase/allantoinase [Sporomusaceae bacterium BoRhaA]|uniref:allantoinase AllB n=1 Tax=Pelorhabdus rhamnosifermentans TaxID=2772457 RepID=UPI001C062C86|nr:allantoinase AllB [Pelorhabdus rhamnosifermentans]MBU2700041.1 dihydropyrimidinase/allantoinase [Pelorhabdus rhamnosifermentans]
MIADLVFKNIRLYTEQGVIDSGVAVKDGKIIAIASDDFLPQAKEMIDGHGQHLLPGGVDPHVHFRDPSKNERETFMTGSMAAAAGGVTTVCEHPISCPPPYSPELLKRRIEIANRQSLVDFAFFGAAGADKLEEISKVAQEDIIAFKTFFHEPPEGRDKEFEGLTMSNDAKIYTGFQEVAKTGKILAIHAENNDIIADQIQRLRAQGKVKGVDHAESRPPISEIESVAKVLCLAETIGTRVQLCHISTGAAAELVKQAKARGREVYLETCPHYLFLNEEALEEFGPFAKCNPPLRKQEIVDELWKYVQDGTVDTIGSDHGPFLTAEKETGYKDIFVAPAGFPGIDLRLPLMLTAVKQGKLTLQRVIELISTNPAKIFGLYPQKGAIQVGADADFVMVDLEKEFVVDRKKGYSKSSDIARVYDGWTLTGLPTMTVIRGKVVMKDGVVSEENKAWGQLVSPHR